MKTLKTVFKPLVIVFVFIAVGCIVVAKKGVLIFKVKSQYKNLVNFNKMQQKLYSLVFNPYRISNGLRPSCMPKYTVSFSDLEKCHELIQQKKQRA